MSFTLDRRTALRGMVNGMAVAVDWARRGDVPVTPSSRVIASTAIASGAGRSGRSAA